jgi:8-oxo-dGTP pyrophosphatase MutT (NUDIX family)
MTAPRPETATPVALPHPPLHRELVSDLRARLRDRRRQAIVLDGYRPAAVALLLRERDGESHVPLIVRPGDMRAHAGQIALPGGVRDECDGSFADCARRETYEELGVPPDQIDVLGVLDDVPTPTGFVITPVVAELRGPVAYRPSPDEVSAVFEAPLAAFADPSRAEDMGEREHWGIRYRVRAYRHGPHRIWGATARVLEALHDVLRASSDAR